MTMLRGCALVRENFTVLWLRGNLSGLLLAISPHSLV